MWNALRSDFKEFVSTVTEDTSQVLSKIDDSFPVLASNKEEEVPPEEEEAQMRMQLEETFTSPLVLQDYDDSEDRQAQLEEFMSSFEVSTELEQDLETYPPLHSMYRQLVPDTVSKRDFWMRYAYRCDADRIAMEWNEEEKLERAAAMSQSISSVKQFLGGAVKSVAASLKEGDVEGSASDTAAGSSTSKTTTTAAGFFGVGGARPPFVMNTAVDESDDEEEEEELGWDDDDEDDDNKDEEEQQESTNEEIEFRDAATEQLQEQLKQALEERDLLHETVAMQAKKIVDLTAQQEEGGVFTAESVEALKLKLFETESELAAVKERFMSSTSFEEPSTPKAEASSEVTPALELQCQVEELQAKLQQTETLYSEVQGKVSELEGTCTSLTNEKQDLVAQVASLQAVVESLQQGETRAERETLERVTQQQVVLQEIQTKLDFAENRILELEQELAAASRTTSAASPDTHESSNSGVKIEAPASMEHATVSSPAPLPVVKREVAEEGSDWGDDW